MLYEGEDDYSIVKVMDFGMARILDSNNQLMTSVCGTPAYMAPEVIMNEKYDISCDIWSLGIVLYVMLCGYPPFDAESNEENMNNIKSGNFKFPSPDWDNVSDLAKDLVKSMITVDPKKRITAKEVLNHEWMVKNVDTKLWISDNLKKYNARRRLKVKEDYFREPSS